MKASTVAALAGLLALGACSSDDEAGDALGLELVTAADFDAEVYTFDASGESVEEGLMCSAGAWIWHGNETPGGDVFTDEALAGLWDAGEPFEMVVVNEYECEDGSGSIVVAEQSTVDPAAPEQSGEVVGSWTVRSGEIDGAAITGEGEVVGGEGNLAALTGTLSEG